MDILETRHRPLGKRERNRINNRKAILEAARTCFREKGFENTTIRDIVRQTRLAAGTFYNYFASKEDIFVALLTDFLNHQNEALSQIRRTSDTTEEFIESTYLALFRSTAEDPLVYELAHRNDQAIKKLFGSGIMGLAMLTLEDDVRDAIDRGLLPPVDIDYLCAAFFGVALELSVKVARRASDNPEAAELESRRAARFASRLFLGGLERMAEVS
ncbi:MAG: TetR/AcrR family transcriptional regulator [Marinobacter sp.]|uniref:TetR/AcrR family transcriptional regulator n=1 Tax=Marinobacter sp. TaxID=50741 RepID=UPI00299F45BB|nr:TetR/AcrR family transcriptional regulator [Marinobacter sp.]MDX1756582.1 TetR/AcrR family transcriptional regulator [Marinobacter sp.]